MLLKSLFPWDPLNIKAGSIQSFIITANTISFISPFRFCWWFRLLPCVTLVRPKMMSHMTVKTAHLQKPKCPMKPRGVFDWFSLQYIYFIILTCYLIIKAGLKDSRPLHKMFSMLVQKNPPATKSNQQNPNVKMNFVIIFKI